MKKPDEFGDEYQLSALYFVQPILKINHYCNWEVNEKPIKEIFTPHGIQ